MAFALFFATMGIPIARWADRGHRGRIMAVTTALWSVAVPLCGAARNFVQLVLARIVAASGQAGCSPTINSLLPDYFGRGERARAMTLSQLYNPLGVILGYGVAGWIGQHYGWRATFVFVGMFGLPLAILAALTVREPRRSLTPAADSGAGGELLHSVTLWKTCVALWKTVSFRHLAMSDVVSTFFTYGIYTWLPTYFVRSYGMKYDELGVWLAAGNGVGGIVSIYLGGELAQLFARKNEPLQLKAIAVLTVCSTIVLGAVFLTHNRNVALWLMVAFILLCLPSTGPQSAIELTIVPQRMRATSVAIVSMLASLIGSGVGPLLGGVLSDLLHPFFGEESLRYALLALTPGYLWCAWHIWAARKTVLQDARMAELELHGAPEQESATSAIAR
jgi:MFS family permease